MTSLLAKTDHLRRWTTCGLVTLLFISVCACSDSSEHTALRFVVYSDARLSRVRVSVLGAPEQEKERFEHDFPLNADAGVRVDAPLLTIQVEAAERSQNREQAVLRFDGFDGNSKLVLSQTFRANFTDKETRFVRIWLARSCANPDAMNCSSESSCSIVTGRCEPQQVVRTLGDSDVRGDERWVPGGYTPCGAYGDADGRDGSCPAYCGPVEDQDCASAPGCGADFADCSADVAGCETDLRTTPNHCGGCNMPCTYRVCEDRVCTAPAVIPSAQDYVLRDATEVTTTYMRRVVKPARGIVAVGGEFKGVGGTVQFFVADDSNMGPGKVLAIGTQMVTADPGHEATGGFVRTEYVFEQPVIASGAAFWIGVRAASTLTRFASFGSAVMETYAATFPALGEEVSGFGEIMSSQVTGQSPYLYARYFP